MRTLFGCGIVLMLMSPGAATPQQKGGKAKTEPVSADKLVGKWKGPSIGGVQAPGREFTKDGKSYLGAIDGKGSRIEATYHLEGNRLTITFPANAGSPAEEHKYTIKKLTSTELILAEGKGTETYKRAK